MKLFAFTFLMLLSGLTLVAQDDATRKKNYNLKKNVALEGYDVVSYFGHQPVEGKEEVSTMYLGVIYRFSNQTNLSLFRANPNKYEPAYGGWCAYAMGETGEKVKIDPETFKIIDGKLYLFYNFWGNNTLTDWNKNERQLKARGDQNWKRFVP